MDSSYNNSDRTRPSMSERGGHSSYNLHAPTRTVQHTSIPSLMHALQPPSSAASGSNHRGHSRRRARASVSETTAAIDDNTSSSPFRPLVLSLPQDMSDWSVTDDAVPTSPSRQDGAVSSSSSLRRTSLHRTRSSNTRKRQSGRRLFGTFSPPVERQHAQRQQEAPRTMPSEREAVNLNGRQAPYSRSRTTTSLDFALDSNNTTSTSSPRLELPEHSLHSFKRSFEDAAFTTSGLAVPNSASPPSTSNPSIPSPSSNGDDVPGLSSTSLTFSPTSPSSSSTSPASPDTAEEEPSVRQFRSILARFETRLSRNSGALTTSTLTSPPIAIPASPATTAVSMSESWLRLAEFEYGTAHQGNDNNTASATSSAIRHTPPTPEHAGSRVKRRRSRTDGSDRILPGEAEPVAAEATRRETTGEAVSLADTDSPNGSVDIQAGYELDENMLADSLELSPHHEEGSPHEETDGSVEMDDVSIYASPLESPSASTPVSVRRGLHRQFSLGALPLFHFEEEDDEETTLDSASAHDESDAAIVGTGASHVNSNRRGTSDSIRFRSRLPRRPNLQRNTTAVSPPEESPLNTPEGGDSARTGESFTRPGLAPWRIPSASTAHPQQANQSQDVAAGEIILPRPSSSFQEALQSRYSLGNTSLTPHRLASPYDDPAYRQLSFDFDFTQEELGVNPMVHNGNRFGGTPPIRASSVVPQLNILGSAENANARLRSETQNTNATSVTLSTSTSSSSGIAGWHSDAERTRAELLSDQLETSRRIAAEVQSLQTRLAEPTTPQANPAAPTPPLRASTSTNAENTRTTTVPPRVSFSSAVGSNSRESPISQRQRSQGRINNHSSRRPENSTNSHADSQPRRLTQPAVFEAPLGPTPRQPLTAFFSAEYRPSHMATADIPYSDAAFWRAGDSNISAGPSHRHGSLGRTNMRGPTRSSNEAWMRSQGIDFYDSHSRSNSLQTLQHPPLPVLPPPSAPGTLSRSQGGQHASQRSSPYRSSRLHERTVDGMQIWTTSPPSTRPSSPVLQPSGRASPPVAVAPSRNNFGSYGGTSIHRSVVQPIDRAHAQPDHSFRYSAGPTEDAALTSRMQRHGRTVSAGHPGVSLSRSGLSGRFTPLPRFSRRTSSPQLDAIRPVSPLLQPANIVNNASRSQGQTNAALTQSLSIPLAGTSAAADRTYGSHTAAARARTAARDNTGNSSIADWFRGHTNELSPTTTTSVEVAATEVEEARDGIAAAVRRLDDVRRILDEVSQNIHRRREALGTRNDSATLHSRQREQQGTSHNLLRGISSYDARNSHPSQDQANVRLSTQLPSIRAPPVASVSRSVHFVDPATNTAAEAISRRNTTNGIATSDTPPSAGERPADTLRPNWRQPLSLRSSTARPTIQPFEEIFAEVEAEFAQRDRSNGSGTAERPSGTRNFLHNLSRQRRQGEPENADADAAAAQPDERRSALRTQIDQYLAEVESLRQHILQPDPHPPRSGFALQDSSNTRLPDIAGLRARATGDSFGRGLFGDSSSLTADAPRAGSGGNSRVSLPPFLSRTLRTRGLFAHREGATGIGSDPRDWMGDSEIDLSYESLMAISERLGDVRRRGATDEALAGGLTVYKYASTTITGTDGETRCAICLEDYEEADEIARSNKCNHALHNNCFTTWLRRVTTCPICRQEAV